MKIITVFLFIFILSLFPVWSQQDTVIVDDSGSHFIAENPNGGDNWELGSSSAAINGNYHFFRRILFYISKLALKRVIR